MTERRLSNQVGIFVVLSNVFVVLVALSWLFPIVFTVYLVSLVVLKAFNVGFSSFEQFKSLLIASETVFGVYVGITLGSMFRLEKQPSHEPAQPTNAKAA
jgi:hypothetical protein